MKLLQITLDEVLEELTYLYISELREICIKLGLNADGKKAWLMRIIAVFLKNHQKVENVIMPKSVYGKSEGLKLDAQMFYNVYKNNSVTREFFKQHIGPHFHFTVFGIDWLNLNWINGIVPTYRDYIEMWTSNYGKDFKPKHEWGYIRFMRRFKGNLNQNEMNKLWKSRRDEAKNFIMELCTERIGSN